MGTAVIHARGVQRLRQGHLWIYGADVQRVDGAEGGEVVAMVDERGGACGYAFYSDSSQIKLRWVAPAGAPPDRDFWRARLQQATDYRRRVVKQTEAYRLVYGESDLLPSLIIDRYGEHIVLQTLSQGSERLKPLLVELLNELFSPASISERNDAAVRQHERLPALVGVLSGMLPAEITARINGLHFTLNLLGGQKTGAFLDQRENYLAAARYAHGRALDAFSFAGGFALHLAPRVSTVEAVDLSTEACALARRNAEINGLTNIDVRQANVFDLLREMDKAGEKFDTIVLDPPAFTKSKSAIAGAYRGYKEINLRALRLLSPGGILITCSCSYHMTEPLFLQMLTEAAGDAGRQVRIIEQRLQARDHPVLVGVPETKYLKCAITEVIG